MGSVKPHLLAILAACALAAAGCNSSTADTSAASSLLATAPTSPLVTENFSGTVLTGSNDAHSFTVTSNNSPITLALTTAGPPATITEGFGVGQTIAGSCQLLSGGFGNYTASTTPQLSGTIPTGTYCVMVYDVGNQTAAITYTVVVNHY
jgi:hypothetical protein